MASVIVTITSRVVGALAISPFTYENNAGLQRYPDKSLVRYTVPTYAVEVKGARNFTAVRFGLVNRREPTPPKTRRCDAGLIQGRKVEPEWVAGYSPHSFT